MMWPQHQTVRSHGQAEFKPCLMITFFRTLNPDGTGKLHTEAPKHHPVDVIHDGEVEAHRRSPSPPAT